MTLQVRNETDYLLAKSFKEIVSKKPVEKITIKDITDKSGVIRPTFYNHFQDKYELLEWIITSELLEPMQPLLKAGMMTEAVMLLFTNMEKEKSFYMKLHKMEGPITFHQVALKCVGEMLLGILEEMKTGNTPKYQWLSPKFISKYYAQAMCLVAEDWIDSGMSVSPREMAEAYHMIMTSSMEDVVKQMQYLSTIT